VKTTAIWTCAEGSWLGSHRPGKSQDDWDERVAELADPGQWRNLDLKMPDGEVRLSGRTRFDQAVQVAQVGGERFIIGLGPMRIVDAAHRPAPA